MFETMRARYEVVLPAPRKPDEPPAAAPAPKAAP
jgi:hypothetical protein